MRQFGKNNKGSNLLLVIIAILFIGILGSLILALTMTNIRMKQVDYQAKENFYQTETVINELQAGLEGISSQCMYEAYDYLLLHYSEILQNPSTSLKAEFDRHYIENLVPALCGSSVSYDPLGGTYYYQPSRLKSFLNSNLQPKKDSIILYPDTPYLDPAKNTNILAVSLDTADPDKVSSVTLKNVKVSFVDTQGFETRITTDIKLEVPSLNFEYAGIYPEFTKYAIIADEQLLTEGGTGMRIDGNIYAGIGGIEVNATNVTVPDINNAANGYNLKITGDTLITRGDLTVKDDAKLFIGDSANLKKVSIWAENIKTTGNSAGVQSSYLNINGNCMVSDDLMLGAKRSDVIISGSYFGYSYSKTNTKIDDNNKIKTEVNSNYSSAILINGINSSLNMIDVKSLMLAGRAFISRKNEAGKTVVDDIMTGESISVKSNQLAYLVPDEYLPWLGHNPVMRSEVDALPSGAKTVDIPVVPGTISDLLTAAQFVEYHYLMGGTVPMVYYYLEFKNQACANQYFREYYSHGENQAKIKENAESYLYGDGIRLSGALLLSANALKTSADGLVLTGGVLANPDLPHESLLRDSIRSAKEYKSRQLCLVPVSAAGNAGDFRLDKASSPLFQTIISQYDNGTPAVPGDDMSVIEWETRDDGAAAVNGFAKYNGNYFKRVPIDINRDNTINDLDYSVYIIRNDSKINASDIITATSGPDLQKGIIIATGDIDFDKSYKGLIISDKTIKLMSNGISIGSSPEIVQDIFSYALEKETLAPVEGGWLGLDAKRFTHYFADYSKVDTNEAENIDQVDISRYITYENWKKNVY